MSICAPVNMLILRIFGYILVVMLERNLREKHQWVYGSGFFLGRKFVKEMSTKERRPLARQRLEGHHTARHSCRFCGLSSYFILFLINWSLIRFRVLGAFLVQVTYERMSG